MLPDVVGDVHVVVLLNESADGATHRDYVVVGVRREYYHALLCGQRTLRTVGVVGVRLAARPSGDGMLQVVKDLDITVVCRTEESEKVGESVLVIVLVGELEDRLLHELAEPNHSSAYRLVGPLAVGDEPRVNDTCQLAGCSEVDDELGVVVCLHERSRNGVGDAAFHNLLHHIRLLFAPCREEHLVG